MPLNLIETESCRWVDHTILSGRMCFMVCSINGVLAWKARTSISRHFHRIHLNFIREKWFPVHTPKEFSGVWMVSTQANHRFGGRPLDDSGRSLSDFIAIARKAISRGVKGLCPLTDANGVCFRHATRGQRVVREGQVMQWGTAGTRGDGGCVRVDCGFAADEGQVAATRTRMMAAFFYFFVVSRLFSKP
jgi:hypothetical protein